MPLARRLAASLRLLLAPLAAASVGCAGASAPSQPAVVFPSRAEIARIPARPPRDEAFGTKDVRAEAWTFETPAAAPDAAYEDPSPWGDFLRERVGARAATASLSASLRCAALEIARFHRQSGGMPAESLKRFTVARCGGTSPDASPIVWWAEAPSVIPDAKLLDRARADLAKAIDERLAGGHRAVGLGAVRDAHGVSVVVLVASDDARVDPGSRRVDASRRITLRGAARGEYAHIAAVVNQGAFGYARCADDPTVKPPRFAVTCAVAAGDPYDWVQIVGRKKGLFLEHVLADVLVEAEDGAASRYEARHHGDPAPVASPGALSDAIVAGVNRVRASARLAPLTVATKQSAENARLVGTLVDAGFGDDDATAEKAALGLLAGWDVEGTIRDGRLLLSLVGPTRDATAWLDFAIERPLGRLTLLDPAAQRIAVGPAIADGGDGLGAVITTYALFGSGDHAAEEDRFFARLEAERYARGLPAAKRVARFESMTAAASRVLANEEGTQDALDDMLQEAVRLTGTTAHGFAYETSDLDHAPIPEDLLAPGEPHLALAITHHRAPGAAWGQYVVFVVIVDERAVSPVREARAAAIARD